MPEAERPVRMNELIGIPGSPLVAESTAGALQDAVAGVLSVVAGMLRIPPRPIRLRIAEGESFLAHAQVWPPHDPSIVTLSPDCFRPSVLAHELTHCLVPTPWLFLAEGLATWVGCQVAGSCEDLLFAESSLEHVLVRHWQGNPPLADLWEEHLECPTYFAPDRFFRMDARMAHVIAASFCGYWLQRIPSLAADAAGTPAPPRALLATICQGHSLNEMEQIWWMEVCAVGNQDPQDGGGDDGGLPGAGDGDGWGKAHQ